MQPEQDYPLGSSLHSGNSSLMSLVDNEQVSGEGDGDGYDTFASPNPEPESPRRPQGPRSLRDNAQKRLRKLPSYLDQYYLYTAIAYQNDCLKSTMTEKEATGRNFAYLAEAYRRILPRVSRSRGCTEMSRFSLLTEEDSGHGAPQSTVVSWAKQAGAKMLHSCQGAA
jgi:hypothetical protein